MRRIVLISSAAAMLLLSACSSEPKKEVETKAAPAKEPPVAVSKVPGLFKVKMETSKGNIIIEVHKDWAPLGAERFYELVQDNFFNGARFFRYVPNFIVQFGLAASPAMTRKWEKEIKDDRRTRGMLAEFDAKERIGRRRRGNRDVVGEEEARDGAEEGGDAAEGESGRDGASEENWDDWDWDNVGVEEGTAEEEEEESEILAEGVVQPRPAREERHGSALRTGDAPQPALPEWPSTPPVR